MQPIKNSILSIDNQSEELKKCLDEVLGLPITDVNVRTVDETYLFVWLLETDGNLLHNLLNSFLTKTAVDRIHYNLLERLRLTNISCVELTERPALSKSLVDVIGQAGSVCAEMRHGLITTDHILIAILRYGANRYIKELLSNENVTIQIAENISNNLHRILTQFSGNTDGNGYTEIRVINDPAQMRGLLDGMGAVPPPSPEINGNPRQASSVPFCTNLNTLRDVDGIYGRDDEMLAIEKALSKRRLNNVMVVGEPGVGKTAIVQGLAKKIAKCECCNRLLGNTIFRLNISELIGGTTLRGMFEDRVNKIFAELNSLKNAILFIDNAHLLCATKNSEENFIGIIDDHLSRNSVKVIMTTTFAGLKKMRDANYGLDRKFTKVVVEQPSKDDCVSILSSLKGKYGKFHHVKYPDTVIRAFVDLAERYVTDEALPASALNLMDECGAMLMMGRPDTYEIQTLKAGMIGKEGSTVSDAVKGIHCELGKMENIEANVDDACFVVSNKTGIPVSKINTSDRTALSKMEDTMKSVIVGQDGAVAAVCKAVRRNRIGLRKRSKPIFSCLCIGSTGVGKTLMAKTLANEVFGDEKYMIRFDMSEYSDKTSTNKLIGSSAGYVGYDRGGLLTEAVRNKKYAVLLIDEIEKANEDVFNLFLQVLDEGFLTDNMGNKVDFRNTVIIMTSNVGARKASDTKAIGFSGNDVEAKKDVVNSELRKTFSPEFMNRIDDIVYFNPLSDDNLRRIIELQMSYLIKEASDDGYRINYSSNVINALFDIVKKEPEYGARPVARAIQNEIENRITDKIINDGNTDFDVFVDDYGKISVR